MSEYGETRPPRPKGPDDDRFYSLFVSEYGETTTQEALQVIAALLFAVRERVRGDKHFPEGKTDNPESFYSLFVSEYGETRHQPRRWHRPGFYSLFVSE